MFETVFVLWIMFDAGRNGGIELESHGPFVSKEECERHAETVKTLMLNPKYARYNCVPKLKNSGNKDAA